MSDGVANEELIHFLPAAQASGDPLASFRDPYSASAVSGRNESISLGADPAFALTVVSAATTSESFDTWYQRTGMGGTTPLTVKVRGAEVWWCGAGAMLRCEPADAAALRTAVLEFTFYEQELRRLEGEVAGSWDALNADRRLACTVTAADLQESEAFATRMGDALGRRIRLARLQPHLLTPDAAQSNSATALAESLREEADVESRAEALDAQLAVFEHIYELASPRMGESRDAHEGQRIEWIIIWLLVAEVVLSLLQVILKRQ